jgi:hypothetical protein
MKTCLVPSTVGVVSQHIAVTEDRLDIKDVMLANSHHAMGWVSVREPPPVGSQPKITNRPSINLHGHSESTKGSPGTTRWMLQNPGLDIRRPDGCPGLILMTMFTVVAEPSFGAAMVTALRRSRVLDVVPVPIPVDRIVDASLGTIPIPAKGAVDGLDTVGTSLGGRG